MLDVVNLLGTYLPRFAARFFPDACWRRIPARPADRPVYLTFDDGPTPEMTPVLLTLLERYDARGTFFLIGRNAERQPHLVRRIHAAGHQIGSHTYSHPDAWCTSSGKLLHELDRTSILLRRITGEPVSLMRPPYGHFTRPMQTWCLTHRQQLTMWDVMPGDFLRWTSSRRVARRVLALVRPGSIIVLHDNPDTKDVTLEALEIILRRLTAEGWRFPAL